jgi:hypothetical protein
MQVIFTPTDLYSMWVEFEVTLNGQPIKVTWSTAEGYGYDIEEVLSLVAVEERESFALEFEKRLPKATAILT